MPKILSKIIEIVKAWQYGLFILLCFGLVSLIGYQIGRISKLEKTPLKLTGASIFEAIVEEKSGAGEGKVLFTPKPRDPRVVVSKASSTKKYHFTWCTGAKQIKEENKIWFANATSAQQAGYTLAGNCTQ